MLPDRALHLNAEADPGQASQKNADTDPQQWCVDYKSFDNKMDLFSGKLSADSSNVVQLVKAQYEAITSSIEMKDNATGSVKVKKH